MLKVLINNEFLILLVSTFFMSVLAFSRFAISKF